MTFFILKIPYKIETATIAIFVAIVMGASSDNALITTNSSITAHIKTIKIYKGIGM